MTKQKQLAPFYYEPMPRERADSLAEAYKKRGKRVEISLYPFDPRLWSVVVMLPVSQKQPRQSRRWQQPVWRYL